MADPQMYVKYRDGKPVAYRFGEHLVWLSLLIKGGYSTQEEAIEAYISKKEKKSITYIEHIRFCNFFGIKPRDPISFLICKIKWYIKNRRDKSECNNIESNTENQ